MPQFLIPPEAIQNNKAQIRGAQAKHLIKVLRYKEGDSIYISDGANRYLAVVETIRSQEATLRIEKKIVLPAAKNPPILATSLLKGDHLEWVIQKCVELGVENIFLLLSERTIPRHREGAAPKKMERLQKIALEAAKQSGMVPIPKIFPPIAFEKLMQELKNYSSTLLAWEGEEKSSLHPLFPKINPEKILLMVGPEGGWTGEEVAEAKRCGAQTIGLGRQILRSETAAISLVTLCQYELGNL